MRNINNLTVENFENSFDLNDILSDSAFYPAAGIDACDIEFLSDKCNSFVHVDYSEPKEDIEIAMRSHFEALGYRLIGLKHVPINELIPAGFHPLNLQLNEHEKQRIQEKHIEERFYYQDFIPFALWAVYELDPSKTGKIEGKLKRFSLLHIGGEACVTFDALYLQQKVNPFCVAIIYAGEGYGDNWTMFTDPNFRLYQSIQSNNVKNGTPMPKYILMNSHRDVLWHNYRRVRFYYCRILGILRLYLFERPE